MDWKKKFEEETGESRPCLQNYTDEDMYEMDLGIYQSKYINWLKSKLSETHKQGFIEGGTYVGETALGKSNLDNAKSRLFLSTKYNELHGEEK